ATLSRLPSEVALVGSHGSEFDIGFLQEITPEARALLARLVDELEKIAADRPGVHLEVKPASVALHVRNASRADGEAALAEVRSGPAALPGVQTTDGKMVIELSVIETDKGSALDELRRRCAASTTVFFGDDVTDEKAFRRLRGPDVGVKVGPEPSGAQFRVDTTEDVSVALGFLLLERRAWLLGENAVPIERLTMLASPDAKALITPDASVTWLCRPAPDSAAVFASLIGGNSAGHFSVRPDHDGLPLGQEYVDATMTTMTRWSDLTVTDYLPHDTVDGRTDLTRVLTGTGTARVEFAPRPEFGQAPVHLEATAEGLRVHGTNDPMVLRAPGVDWQITDDGRHQSASALIPMGADPVLLELRMGSTDLAPAPAPEQDRRADAEAHWRDWAASLDL